MRNSRLFQNWDATIKVAFIVGIALLGSIAVNVFLAWKLANSMERTILLPANPSEAMTVEKSSASRSYIESWAVYFTGLLGAVTPSNAQSIADYLGKHVDQRIWHAVRAQVLAVVDDPQYNRINAFNMFVPKRVLYEPDTNKTFVEGTLTTLSYRAVNLAVGIPATYELEISIRNGLPVVTHLNSYSGIPRTAQWIGRNRPVLEAEKKTKDREEAQAILRRDDLLQAQIAAEAAQAAQAAQSTQPSSGPAAVGSSATASTSSSTTTSTVLPPAANAPSSSQSQIKP